MWHIHKRLHQPLRYTCHTGIINGSGIMYTCDAGCLSISASHWENELHSDNDLKLKLRLKRTTPCTKAESIWCVDCGSAIYENEWKRQQLTRDVLSQLRVKHVKCVWCLCAHTLDSLPNCAVRSTSPFQREMYQAFAMHHPLIQAMYLNGNSHREKNP